MNLALHSYALMKWQLHKAFSPSCLTDIFFPQMPRTFFKAAMTVFKLALWIQSSHLLNGTLHWSICPTIPANQHTFLCNVARPLFLVENRESSEYAASIILENLRASSPMPIPRARLAKCGIGGMLLDSSSKTHVVHSHVVYVVR